MAKVDKKYHKLLNTILDKGRWYEDPNRKRVKRLQIPHYSFKYDLKDGFPAITTKKLYWKGVVGELLWFLRSDTNIKYLVDNNINIWNKDAYNYYVKNHNNIPTSYDNWLSALKNSEAGNNLGDLGRVYGAQWKKWLGNSINFGFEDVEHSVNYIDQISNLIKNLKEKPLATDHIVTAWNPAELNDMALPPCHKGFQLMVYELTPLENLKYADKSKVPYKAPKYGFDLVWEQRSVDTFLGLPFNIASYALLCYIIGKLTNMIPGKIIGDLRNVHIYDNAIDAVKKQLNRDVNKYDKCKLKISESANYWLNRQDQTIDQILELIEISDFNLDNYKSYNNIKTEMLSRDE